MEAGKKSINDIFNGNRVLEIPFFQRAYVWGEEQWERLLEDMEEVSLENSRPYFMGSVILKQQQTSTNRGAGDLRTIIDGQQRLTTLNIFFKVLCLKVNTPQIFDGIFRLLITKEIALKHNHNDIRAFEAIMDLASLDDIEGNSNILNAYKYFRANIDESKLNVQMIISRVLFVGIDLMPDEDEQQIFDTINSLGVTLTTAELLKNYFFSREKKGKYEIYWQDVFEKDEETKAYWDKKVTTGRFKRTFIDLFFFSYLQIKLQDGSVAAGFVDKQHFSKVDKLFESYKHFIRDYFDNNSDQLLPEIKEYAGIFREKFNPEIINDELPAEPGIERINAIIFALETTTLIPYVLYVERNVVDEKIKNDLYSFIEAYVMRRLITRATTKNYNQLFTDRLILHQVLTKQQFLEYLSAQDDTVNYLPDDDQLQAAFHGLGLTNKQAAGALYMIESKIRNRQKHATRLLGISKYSLEHVMPKKWENHWDAPVGEQAVQQRNRKLLTLGNLTIITQALNASIRDENWETKKNGRGDKGGLKRYADGIETFSKYLDLPSWNESEIEHRAEELYDKALEVWRI